MKKLMLIAAFVCTCAANAANFNWMTGEIYAPGADGNGWSATDALIAGTGYTTTIYCFTDATMEAAWAGLTDGKSVITSDPDSSGWISGSVENIEQGDRTLYAYMTVVDSAGNTLTSNAFSFEWTQGAGCDIYGGSSAGDTLSPVGDYTFDEVYGQWQTTGWVAASAPEPTSGLLLLLGMAGLALKRKRT